MSSNENLVSVVIPAYNHEKYIQEAVESVINQTYEDIELLVVDDGSSDKTWDMLCELRLICEKRFRRVVFLRQENKGVSLTMRRLLENAAGYYITSLASDDRMEPSLVEESLVFLKSNTDYGVVFFDAAIMDDTSRHVYWDKNRHIVFSREEAKYLTMGDFLRDIRPDVDFLTTEFGSYESLLKGNYIPSAPFYHRSLLNKTGSYSEAAPLEDWYINLQLAKHARFKFIDKSLWRYRWHSDNTVKKVKKMKQMASLTIRYEINQLIAANEQVACDILHRCFKRTKIIWGCKNFYLYKTKSFDKKKIGIRFFSYDFAFTYKQIL